MSLAVDTPLGHLPHLHESAMRIGACIKQHVEDFVVEEIPRYQPSGSGTHIYFCIEKRGLTTLSALRSIASALKCQPRDIGYAGLKDAQAVTRQVFSIEHARTEQIEGLALKDIEVVWVSRHTNKLKLGHLAGNRFRIRLREIPPRAAQRVRVVLDGLIRRGVPNYFGAQRFGTDGANARIGRAIVGDDPRLAVELIIGQSGGTANAAIAEARSLFWAGHYRQAADAWPAGMRDRIQICRRLARKPDDYWGAWMAVDHSMRRLYVSALQSQLFNVVLARRLQTFDELQTGDLAYKHVNGACFVVENASFEQPRCARFEISPSGPVFGHKISMPRAQPARCEQQVLAESGINLQQFARRQCMKLPGARRPLRIPLGSCELTEGCDDRAGFIELAFTLPPGSYATSVLREICAAPDASPS